MANDDQTKSQQVKWLVMVYLAGDNNLSEECVFDLTEMKKARLGENVAVVAQLDSGIHDGTRLVIHDASGRTPGKFNSGSLEQALEIAKNGAHENKKNGKGKSETLTYESPESASQNDERPLLAEKILEFVKACTSEFKGTHNMLVLNGHGSGVVQEFLQDNDPDRLTVSDLGKLLSQVREILGGKKLDIFGMDSCLMSMLEVAFEVKDHAEIMISAEGFEPLAGWPYQTILEGVDKFSGREPSQETLEELAKNIVVDYVRYYTDYQAAGISVDQAACRLSRSDALVEAIENLATTLLEYMPELNEDQQSQPEPEGPEPEKDFTDRNVRNAVLISHWQAQPYKNERYTDLFDFCQLLQRNCREGRVPDACQQVMDAIKDGFVVKSCYSGPAVQHSHGVSIYFPWSKDQRELTAYKTLKFTKPKTGERVEEDGQAKADDESPWIRFLIAYLSNTKRRPRQGRPPKKNFNRRIFPIVADLAVAEAVFTSNHKNGLENKNGWENKNGIENKDIGNMPGTMRNPPTDFFVCNELPEGRDAKQAGASG